MSRKVTGRKIPSIILLILLILPAIQPAFHVYFGADALLHFLRMAQLDRAIRHGLLYPRWLPDLGLGFGFPLFNYYAPLSYYLLLPLRWLGLSLSTTLLIGAGLALWALAWIVYLWARDLFGETAGWAAALAVAYAPSILIDLWWRGAWPSVWGLVWLTLTLWALRRSVASGGTTCWSLLLALAYAALMLTHNITAMVSTPLIVGYMLVLALLYGFRPVLRILPFIAIGAGLSAFFWLPAILEQKYVQIHQVFLPSAFDYRRNFLSLAELVSPPRPVDPAQVNFYAPMSLGWIPLGLAILSWWPVGARLPREQRAHRWGLSLAVVGMALLTLPVSRPFWDTFSSFLKFVQFPWRFLGPASVGLAILAGAGAAVPTRRNAFWLSVMIAGMMLFSLTWLFPFFQSAPADLTPPEQIRFETERGGLGATALGEYLPIWVQELPDPETLLPLYEASAPESIIPRLDPACLPPGATILDSRYGLTEAELTLESPQPFRVRFFWYFFPGWEARLDGRPRPLFPDGPHGLIAADVPAGRHHLRVAFGDTPLRRWAWRISGFSLILLIGAGIWVGRSGYREEPGRTPFVPPWRALLACAGLALALTGVKTFYLDRTDNLFRHTRFDGRQVRGVKVPLEVNFGGQMALMGYDLSTPTIRADEFLEVTLYWRTIPPVNTDYSIGFHLVDDAGRLYGQQDHIHPANYYPTSRIRPDQYARDVHRLTPWEGTPPGRYTLLVLVYERQSGYRLGLQDAAGTPLGTTTYPLAQIEVTHPRRFPATEKLPLHRRLDADMGDSVQLVGSGPLPEQVEVGHSFPLLLYWRASARPSADYRARLRLVSEEGVVATELLFVPGRNDHPTSSWTKEEIVRDVRSIFVPAVVLGDPTRPVRAGRYILRLDLLDPTGLPLTEGTDLGTIPVTVPERQFTVPSISRPVGLRLGEMATLLGYDLGTTALRAGETLTLTLYWRSDQPTEQSYTVFVHLMGPDGRIYAQRDLPPAGGIRPTTGWFPGEVIRDEYSLLLPPDAPPGEYHLAVGWYDQTTGQRVTISGADGTPLGDHLLLPEDGQPLTVGR